MLGILRNIFFLVAALLTINDGSVWGIEKPAISLGSGGHILGFYPDRLVMGARDHAVAITFAGARPVIPAAKERPSLTNPEPGSKVVYSALWRDIDLVYEKTDQGVVKSTYLVAPGGDPAAIRLRYNQPVRINPKGELVVRYASGEWREAPPVAWEELDGTARPVSVSYRPLNDQEIGFSVSGWSGNNKLVIDPVAVWNTFLGSSQEDLINGIAVDGNGFIYVTGTSQYDWGSVVINPFPGQNNANAFVAKLDGAQGILIWNTFLGSPVANTGLDEGQGIALDGDGNIYITGKSNLPWGTNPTRAHSLGGSEAFVVKLDSANGQVLKHTFLGATGFDDAGQGLLAKNGKVYVVGKSNGSWLNAPEPVRGYSGAGDIFVARMNEADLGLEWYTFLGSFEAEDDRPGLAVDGAGNVYVTGTSPGAWGSPKRPHSPTGRDAFAAKLNSSGVLQWNTFLGSGGQFYGQGVAVDGSGNVYIAGYGDGEWTEQPLKAYAGWGDGFVAKLDNDGAYQWHTFLGSGSTENQYNDRARGITLDNDGNILIIGDGEGSWGTPLNPFSSGDPLQVFVAKLRPTGEIIWNTFVGSDLGYDVGRAVAVDAGKNVYLTGESNASWGSPQRVYSNGYDAFVAKLSYRTISGTVTYGGFALGGVTIALSTGGGTVTDSSGFYQITVPDGWSGTVTPSLVPYIFSPASQTFPPLGADVQLNFTSTEAIQTISGYIREGGAPLAGITVTAVGSDPTIQTVTNAGGFYQISVRAGWSGTVTPSQPGYAFSPLPVGRSTTYTSIASNYTNQDFSATWLVYISGRVTQNSSGLSEVELNGLPPDPLSQEIPKTDANGYYRVRVRYNWTGTVTPTYTNKLFSSVNADPQGQSFRTYSNVKVEQPGQDYQGRQAHTVSGRIDREGIWLAGITLTAGSGPTAVNTVTDNNGYYQFTLDLGWSGTVTPSHPSYTFAPASWTTGDLQSDHTVDFDASWAVYISGTIKKGTTGVSGVLLGGLPGPPVYTDGNGAYLAQTSYSWSGFVVPTLNHYRFSPEYKPYNNIIGLQVDQDYQAISVYYISGFVKEGLTPVAGVTVAASNGGGSNVTDGNGYYSLTVDEGWSGTVTPSRDGYTFVRSGQDSYTAVNQDWPNQDFSATWLVYISGSVSADGLGLGGVHLNGLPGDQRTQPDGSYKARVDFNWYGTVTPTLAGYTFDPVSRNYGFLQGEQAGQDYLATVSRLYLPLIIKP